MILLAVRTISCSLLRSDLVAETNQTVTEVQSTDYDCVGLMVLKANPKDLQIKSPYSVGCSRVPC